MCAPNLAKNVNADGTLATEAKDTDVSSKNCLAKEMSMTSGVPLELTCKLTIKAIVEM